MTPVERPPLTARVRDWMANYAVVLVTGLLALVAALGGTLTAFALRRR